MTGLIAAGTAQAGMTCKIVPGWCPAPEQQKVIIASSNNSNKTDSDHGNSNNQGWNNPGWNHEGSNNQGSDHGDHGGPGPQRVCRDHCWFSLSYLMGFVRHDQMPAPLVTTSNGVTPPFGGLGSPSTSILFGDTLRYSMQSGIRLNSGFFLDNCGTVARLRNF